MGVALGKRRGPQIVLPRLSIGPFEDQVYARDSGAQTYDLSGFVSDAQGPVVWGLRPRVIYARVVLDGAWFVVQGLSAGTPAPSISYQWRLNGVDIGTDDAAILDPGGVPTCIVTVTSAGGSDALEATV